MTSLRVAEPSAPPKTWRTSATTLLQGAVIGVVELVPGVSGGTMALVLGIYDRLILSASHFVQGVVAGVGRKGGSVAGAHFRQVEWRLVLPLGAGMILALLALAGPLHFFVDTQPILSRALFFGMIVASLLVPITMVRQLTPPGRSAAIVNMVVVFGVAAGMFILLGMPGIELEDPAWWVLIASGAVAVCALVLPGLSGSFILLTVGLYEPTLEAVSQRDLGYLVLFAGGAVLGLGTLVRALAYLLRKHRRPTMLVATGLILGSLRAIWPWQDGTALLAPATDAWGWPLLAALVGGALVAILWLRERRAITQQFAEQSPAAS